MLPNRQRASFGDAAHNVAFRYYPRLERVERYVHDQGLRGVTLEEAAHKAGLEPKYFSAYFRSKVGVRFRDWIWLLRIDRAKELMRNRYAGIAGVAFAAGFGDVRSFERAFKRITGMTPAQWRTTIENDVLEVSRKSASSI